MISESNTSLAYSVASALTMVLEEEHPLAQEASKTKDQRQKRLQSSDQNEANISTSSSIIAIHSDSYPSAPPMTNIWPPCYGREPEAQPYVRRPTIDHDAYKEPRSGLVFMSAQRHSRPSDQSAQSDDGPRLPVSILLNSPIWLECEGQGGVCRTSCCLRDPPTG
jgi:hypothetical protein